MEATPLSNKEISKPRSIKKGKQATKSKGGRPRKKAPPAGSSELVVDPSQSPQRQDSPPAPPVSANDSKNIVIADNEGLPDAPEVPETNKPLGITPEVVASGENPTPSAIAEPPPHPPAPVFKEGESGGGLGLEQIHAAMEPAPQPPAPVITPPPSQHWWEKKRKQDWEEEVEDEDEMQTKAPREKLFSDAHPRAYEVACNILPRIHSISLGLWLAYMAMMEILRKNWDFAFDWYNSIPLLPTMVATLSDGDRLGAWFDKNMNLFLIVAMFVIWAVVMFYLLVWRYFFKTYWKVSNNVESPEGRIYWYEGNMWVRLWDRIYNSPPRKTISFWIKTTPWYKPLNIFVPASSCIKLTISNEEDLEYRGPWKLWVYEKARRRMVSVREYFTIDGHYDSVDIPQKEASSQFNSRSREMIADTHLISLGNPSVRLDGLKNSSFPVPNELRELILNARKDTTPKEPQPNTEHSV